MGSHTRHVPTRRQHIFRLALIYRQTHFRKRPFAVGTKRLSGISHRAPKDIKDSVRKKLETLVENSGIAMHIRLPKHTLHEKIEEVAR